jgi:hypothetical protein
VLVDQRSAGFFEVAVAVINMNGVCRFAHKLTKFVDNAHRYFAREYEYRDSLKFTTQNIYVLKSLCSLRSFAAILLLANPYLQGLRAFKRVLVFSPFAFFAAIFSDLLKN